MSRSRGLDPNSAQAVLPLPNITVPEGFLYRPDLLTEAEEQALLQSIVKVRLSEVRMHGVVARRRVAHFGWLYGYESWRIEPGPPLPDAFHPLRARVAALIGLASPDELEEVLLTEYRPGATIGWHRDAPMFGPVVVGVSLLGACRMRFRRRSGDDHETATVRLEPRSVYIISGEARRNWQHSIPATKELRYSITFRTVINRP
jgi:alkylated DNA repair dioxygenase AlkB